MTSKIKRSSINILLNLVAPGFGYIHNSKFTHGFSTLLATLIIALIGVHLSPFLIESDIALAWLFVGSAITVWAIRIVSTIDSAVYSYRTEYMPSDLKKKGAYFVFISVSVTIYMFQLSDYRNIKAMNFPTTSMVPTVAMTDNVLVNKLSYSGGQPKRGDIVAFANPDDLSVTFLKRVIGLPNERISFKNKKIYINDSLIEEDYAIYDGLPPGEDILLNYAEFEWIQVRANEVFLLGDNRYHSVDSRIFGAIPLGLIRGKVIGVYSLLPPKFQTIN